MQVRTRTAMLAIAAVLASTSAASVHPHVFAEARLDVVVNPDGTVKSLQHVWRFDDRGRIVRFRHAADTFAHAAALK